MAEELREALRLAISDDNASNERYDDYKLNIFINIALKHLASRVSLDITITDGNLSRVPTSTEFILIMLQTQCIIATKERYQAVKKGVKVTQDESSVDTTGNLSAFQEAVAGEGGVCTQLENAITEYIATGAVELSSVTSENAENIWHGNQKLYEDVDHDGQGNERIWTPRKRSHIDRDIDGGSATDDQGRMNTW